MIVRTNAPIFQVLALAAVAVVVPAGWSSAAEPETSATRYVSAAEARMRADVTYLADDLREGRGVGTRGLDDAAEYIATVFREAGLEPAPGADGYFQNFTLPSQPTLTGEVELAVNKAEGKALAGRAGIDFSPLGYGGGADLEGVELVFAGYGITADDADLGLEYDDYAGIDAEGKAVLVIRREPQQADEDSPFAGTETTSYATFRHKYRNALDHGATAVLLVNDAAGLGEEPDTLLDFEAAGFGGGDIPLVMLTREYADKLLAAAGAPTLEALEAKIDENLEPLSQPLDGLSLDASYQVERERVPVKNVVGVLEGEGPLADETIIVGGHYDHLGFGGQGSLAFGSRDIHNGADDNASGTAMVLELARRLAARNDPLPRRVVFMAFSGEERGLLGSRHYVDNPPYPLDQTVAMLNYDMVGRLEDDDLTIYGAGSTPGMTDLVKALAASQGLDPSIIEDAGRQFGASDHASFYNKDIPVLFAFTGTHPDYHKPSDDTDKVNFEGMARIADFGELILLDLARRTERPAFTALPSPRASGSLASASGSTQVYMGTRPAYDAEVEGVKLDGVAEDSPAEKAGLRGDDIIVGFGGQPVKNIEDFMSGLMTQKPGNTVDVEVLRGGERVTLKVTLGTRGAN